MPRSRGSRRASTGSSVAGSSWTSASAVMPSIDRIAARPAAPAAPRRLRGRTPACHATGSWMAAVLAAGPNAVLSHHRRRASGGCARPAAPRPTSSLPRHVDRPEIDARRIALPPDETTVHRGIPVTTPARTLLDLAGDADPAAARSGDHRGGDQPPRKPHLPRRPGRAPPEGDRGPRTCAGSSATPPTSAAPHPLRPRDRIPRLPRRLRPPAPADERDHARRDSRSSTPPGPTAASSRLTLKSGGSPGASCTTTAPRSPPSSPRSSPSPRPQRSRNRRTGR